VIFLDTGFLFALISARDEHHERVIHRATPDQERAAFSCFRRYRDQTYSFVDCLGFIVRDEFEIREALTVDSDFTHRFVARPGPKSRRQAGGRTSFAGQHT
jgi:predicted nucleic acid-binding protein